MLLLVPGKHHTGGAATAKTRAELSVVYRYLVEKKRKEMLKDRRAIRHLYKLVEPRIPIRSRFRPICSNVIGTF